MCKSAPSLSISVRTASIFLTAIASLPFPLSHHDSNVPRSSCHTPIALLSCTEDPAAHDAHNPEAQWTLCTMFWHRPHAIHCPTSVHTGPNSTHYHHAFGPVAQGFVLRSHWFGSQHSQHTLSSTCDGLGHCKALAPHFLCTIIACLSLCQNGCLKCSPAGAIAKKFTFSIPLLNHTLLNREKRQKWVHASSLLLQRAQSLAHSLCYVQQVAPGAAESGSKQRSAAVLHVTA